ncbi:MAG: HAD-IA family hydrolase [Planctomycetia bacterium]
MRYDLVAWDFDGTVADTLPTGLRIYNELAGKHGFVPVVDAQAARGLSTREFLKKHRISMTKLPRATREFLAIQRGEMEKIPLFDGLVAVLKELQSQGCRLAIVSSNDKNNIVACLKANGADGLFDTVVGCSRLFGKSSAIKKLARAAKIGVDRMLYVGDEVRDCEAAQKAGVDVAAVTWGMHTEELLLRYNPTFLVHRPDELLDVVQ